MSFAAAFLLGAIQGLTEFLPVSSSGHLVLARQILPDGLMESPGILLEVVVHVGTLAAALVYLRRDVAALVGSLLRPGRLPPDAARSGRRLLLLLAVATVPAALAGLLLGGPIRAAFASTGAAAVGLILTGAVLLGTRRRDLRPDPADPRSDGAGDAPDALPAPPARVGHAVFIGFAQALAILPGVSRSGMTITAARMTGLPAGSAARFSFLLSAPVILGASAVELVGSGGAFWPSPAVLLELAVGFVAAVVFGAAALHWVFAWLGRGRFHSFGWYCLAAGGIGFGFSSV